MSTWSLVPYEAAENKVGAEAGDHRAPHRAVPAFVASVLMPMLASRLIPRSAGKALPMPGRPPVATERLSVVLPDGRLMYQLEHRWRDGTKHMMIELP